MKREYAFSERRACGLVMVAVSTYRYEARREAVAHLQVAYEVSERRMRRHARGCASWRQFAGGSGIDGCTCCCGDVENGLTTRECIGSIARRS